MQEAKLCSIHILKLSDGCAQGPEALAKFLSVANTLCVRSALQTELPAVCSVCLITFCQNTITALFGFLFLKRCTGKTPGIGLGLPNCGREIVGRKWRKGDGRKGRALKILVLWTDKLKFFQTRVDYTCTKAPIFFFNFLFQDSIWCTILYWNFLLLSYFQAHLKKKIIENIKKKLQFSLWSPPVAFFYFPDQFFFSLIFLK